MEARQVVVYAHEEARLLDHGYIGTEHLLLGLLHEPRSNAALTLSAFDVPIDEARAEVERIVGRGEPSSGQVPLTPNAKKVLEQALHEALANASNAVETEHLLLALVSIDDSVAVTVLKSFEVTPSRVRQELVRFDDRHDAQPQRKPAEYAVELARDRFWRDEQQRLIGTHPEFPDAAHFLDLSEELAHGVLLVLSRLPAERRSPFAEVFFDERQSGQAWTPVDPDFRRRAAASVALVVFDLAVDALKDPRIEDLLTGIAQGDDLTQTPLAAVVHLEKAIAHVRFSLELEDPANPKAAASLAVAEVLAPAGDVVDLKAVVARSCWAAVESWDPSRVMGFLLQLAHILDAP